MNAKLARETWAMIYRLIFEGVAQDRMHAACEYTGVPPGVIKTLIHLDPAVGTPMRDLASHFGVDASYITSLVDELEQAGLAERMPHPTDRRVKTVCLTAKGVEIQHRVHELMWEPPASFEALTPTELKQLNALLTKLVAADQKLSGESAPFSSRRPDQVARSSQ
jgi:MarR family transcriptional regulator, organic hydroperoxide resistance regulator